MEQYILKDTILAEIDRLGEVQPLNEFQPKEQNKIDWLAGKLFTITNLKLFLNTLEVKEVDLDKEIQEHIKECLDVKFPTTDIELIKKDVAYTARKFFELGMSVSNKVQKEE